MQVCHFFQIRNQRFLTTLAHARHVVQIIQRDPEESSTWHSHTSLSQKLITHLTIYDRIEDVGKSTLSTR